MVANINYEFDGLDIDCHFNGHLVGVVARACAELNCTSLALTRHRKHRVDGKQDVKLLDRRTDQQFWVEIPAGDPDRAIDNVIEQLRGQLSG